MASAPRLFRSVVRAILAWAALVVGVSLATAQPNLSWVTRHERSAGGAALWGIADGNAGIVAVGTGGRILHSRDGVSWATRDAGTDVWLVAVAFGAGRYVAVGDRGVILSSVDAVNWTQRSAPTVVRLNNVVFAQDKFVAVGEGGTIMTSAEGERWQQVDNQAKGWLRGLAFGNDSWMATGQDGVALTSLDGLNWTLRDAGTIDLEAVAYSYSFNYSVLGTQVRFHSSYFRAVGASGRAPYLRHGYKLVGQSVTEESFQTGATAGVNGATNIRFRSIAIAPGLSVATGEDGSAFAASVPEFGWRRLETGTRRNLVGSAFAQGAVFLVGEEETIIQSERVLPTELGNISARGVVAHSPLIVGIRIALPPNRTADAVLRAAGPVLGTMGVSDALADPVLQVFDAAGQQVAANAGWGENPQFLGEGAKAGTGAFPFAPGSKDSALLHPMSSAESFTMHVRSASGQSGAVLAEVYPRVGRVTNMSARGRVGGGDAVMIAGFVVAGQASCRLLVRGVGPGLGQFGVAGGVPDPLLTVYDAAGIAVAVNNDWGDVRPGSGFANSADDVRLATGAAGAFPLLEGSRDAALLLTLVPGSYTAELRAVGAGGDALLEVFEIP